MLEKGRSSKEGCPFFTYLGTPMGKIPIPRCAGAWAVDILHETMVQIARTENPWKNLT
jgi:hypothetical protein